MAADEGGGCAPPERCALMTTGEVRPSSWTPAHCCRRQIPLAHVPTPPIKPRRRAASTCNVPDISLSVKSKAELTVDFCLPTRHVGYWGSLLAKLCSYDHFFICHHLPRRGTKRCLARLSRFHCPDRSHRFTVDWLRLICNRHFGFKLFPCCVSNCLQ